MDTTSHPKVNGQSPIMTSARWAVRLVLAMALLGGVAVRAESPLSFADDFEEATLNPFWLKMENAGKVIFPSTDQVHSGIRSVQLSSSANAEQKNIELYHLCSRPIYGRVSVWVFDSGADIASANYIGFNVRNQELGMSASLFTQDYDQGAANGGHYYYSKFDGTGGNSPVDRTQGWHHFVIHATEQTLTLAVDGVVVHTGPGGIRFDRVALEIHGPAWRPAATVYFDDFELQETLVPTIPGLVYFSTVGTTATATSNFKIKRALLDGSAEVETILASPSGSGRFGGIAFDVAQGHLYTGNGRGLLRANLDGSSPTTLVRNTSVTDVELDLMHGKVYWSDTARDRIYRANLNGSGAEIVVRGKFVDAVEGLALDAARGKLYFAYNTSPAASAIRVVNLDGTGLTTCKPLPKFSYPFDIEADLATGSLYWNEYGLQRVQKSRLECTGPMETVFAPATGFSNGIHVDSQNKKIYYAALQNKAPTELRRANLDGTEDETILFESESLNYIEVLWPLVISSQPVSQAVPSGGEATLSVVAGGIGTLSYQWRLNGQDIQNATEPSLHLRNVTPEQAGLYSVTACGAYGCVTSLEATLAVMEVKRYAGITLAAPSGTRFRIEYNDTDSETEGWTLLAEETVTTTSNTVLDVDSADAPTRRYRAAPLP